MKNTIALTTTKRPRVRREWSRSSSHVWYVSRSRSTIKWACSRLCPARGSESLRFPAVRFTALPRIEAIPGRIACTKLFTFDPERVPSIRAATVPGQSSITKPCGSSSAGITSSGRNVKRRTLGMAEVRLFPGAYEPEEVR